MVQYTKEFGFQIYGHSLGETWLHLVECVLKNGCLEFDENRARLALQNVRIKSASQQLPDACFEHYGNRKNIDAMIDLVFTKDTMEDFDLTPSFRAGAKSYRARLREGKMIEFVVKRLTEIPESKKAVMVFPTYEDYAKVLAAPYNDYLPCIVSVQFRLRPQPEGYALHTIFNMRSQDVFQKCAGDMTVMAMLTHRVADALSENLHASVTIGSLEGVITDAHIYKNTEAGAYEAVARWRHEKRGLALAENA